MVFHQGSEMFKILPLCLGLLAVSACTNEEFVNGMRTTSQALNAYNAAQAQYPTYGGGYSDEECPPPSPGAVCR